jgi:hypothetical protein
MSEKTMAARAALALLALASAACSSGSKGPTAAPAPWPSTSMFYTDGAGGLVAVDPVSLATLAVEPAVVSTVALPVLLSVGTWDAGLSLLDKVHTHAVVYRKVDAASGEVGVWAASAAPGAGAAPRRLSTFSSAANALCTVRLFPDHAAPDASAVVVETAGVDASCATTVDNALVLVRLSDPPAASPRPYASTGSAVVAAVPSATGGIQGWLVRRSVGGLWYEPSDWATPSSTRLTTSNAVGVLATWPGKVWLSVDGNLEVLAAGAAALAHPGGVPAALPAALAAAIDERHLYVVETGLAGAMVQRVLLDGSGALGPLHNLGTDAATALVVSGDRVAYRTQAGEWKAFPKAGGATVSLYTPPASTDGVEVLAAGGSFYFTNHTRFGTTVVDPSGATTSHGGTAVATNPATGRYSHWAPLAGATARFGSAPAQNPDRMLRIDADETAQVTTLTAFVAATATQLGDPCPLPPEYATSVVLPPVIWAEGSGRAHTALVTASSASGYAFLAVNADGAPTLGVVSPPDANSARGPVGTAFGGCSTGAGVAAAPAVLALLGLRLVRRRRG